MRCKLILLVLFFAIRSTALAQISIHFLPLLNKERLILNSGDDSLNITGFKFYISDLCFNHQGIETGRDPVRFHLVDASDPYSLTILIHDSISEFDTISFGLGIDSITSVSGVFGGDLDPVYGMYWTWQSGYINLKLEGFSILSPRPDHSFQFHLGGYAVPHNSYRVVKLPAKTSSNLEIRVDTGKFFDSVNLSIENNIMSPSAAAMILSDKATQIFSVIRP
jgi:hypothetical protein